MSTKVAPKWDLKTFAFSGQSLENIEFALVHVWIDKITTTSG